MGRIISVSNRKGGSGKTTTSVNVSAALARNGNKVLLIDADPQAHTTLSFGMTSKDINMDLYSLLMDRKKTEQVITGTYLNTLKLIPATRRLTAFERDYSGLKEARVWFAGRIAEVTDKFDYIIIDTPPTLSLLSISALIASGEVLIPMQTHFLSLEGLAEMVRLISQIKKLYNPEIELKGVIPTFYKEKTRLSKSILYEISKNLGAGIILHPVRVNISLAEAPSYGKTIFQYNIKSNGAHDYMALARQIEELK